LSPRVYEQITRGFYGLRGVKQDHAETLLADVHSPGGSKNVRVDGRGRIRKSEGYRNVTAVVGPVDADDAVRGLFEFHYELAGFQFATLVAVSDDMAYADDTIGSIGINFVAIGSGLNTFLQPTAATLGGKLYIASGGLANVKSWDGASFGDVGGSQPTAGSLADGGSAGNHVGQYRMKYAYLDADGEQGIASPASDPLIVEGRTITATVSNGPGGTTGKVVYLTAGNNPKFYYFGGVIDDNSTTTLTIDLTDSELIQNPDLLSHGDPPMSGVRLVAAAAGMLWVAKRSGERSTVWPSDIGLPESFSELRRISINEQDGDQLMHMEPEFTRVGETNRVVTMVFFKRRGIWNLFGVQPDPNEPEFFSLERSKSPVGAVSSASVVKVDLGDDNVLAFIATDRTIRVYDGYKSVVISNDVREEIGDINLTHADKAWSALKPSLKLAVFVFPKGATDKPNYALAWDYDRNLWFPYPDWTELRCGTTYHDALGNDRLVAGQADDTVGGHIYELFSGTDFEGSAFESVWRSKSLLQESRNTKEFIALDPKLQQAAGVTVTVKAWAGYEDADTATPHVDTTMSAEEAGVTLRHEPIFLEDSNGDPIVDTGVQVQFSDNSSDDPWALEGFDLTVMFFPGRDYD
jgi:hypothetical protein